MKTYKCPVCGSALSKEHYEHALGIVEAQKKALNAERLQISKERAQLGARIAEAKATAEKKALGKTQRLVQGKDKMIESLRETVRQLREGTTPQTDGLEFEDKLTSRLKREFPSDLIEHKGKSGDILPNGKDEKVETQFAVGQSQACLSAEHGRHSHG
jgi:DNA repair exonuclease SbcCD ATPase subunit